MRLRKLVEVLRNRGTVKVVMKTNEMAICGGYLEKGQMAIASLTEEGNVLLDHRSFLEFNKQFETEGAEYYRDIPDILPTHEELMDDDFEWCDIVDENSLSSRLYKLYQLEKEDKETYVQFLEKKLSKCILI